MNIGIMEYMNRGGLVGRHCSTLPVLLSFDDSKIAQKTWAYFNDGNNSNLRRLTD